MNNTNISKKYIKTHTCTHTSNQTQQIDTVISKLRTMYGALQSTFNS